MLFCCKSSTTIGTSTFFCVACIQCLDGACAGAIQGIVPAWSKQCAALLAVILLFFFACLREACAGTIYATPTALVVSGNRKVLLANRALNNRHKYSPKGNMTKKMALHGTLDGLVGAIIRTKSSTFCSYYDTWKKMYLYVILFLLLVAEALCWMHLPCNVVDSQCEIGKWVQYEWAWTSSFLSVLIYTCYTLE